MAQSDTAKETVFLKVDELNLSISEAENILRALRGGEVDGVIVTREGDKRVLTLSGAEHPYRVVIENMSEGAVTLTGQGNITYCNKKFAEMVDVLPNRLIGSPIAKFVSNVSKLQTLLDESETEAKKDEINLKTAEGRIIPTLFSVSPLQLDETFGLCIVVTDLTDQRLRQELEIATKIERTMREQAEAAKRDLSNVLESITDSYMALDNRWIITDANERAAAISGRSRAELIGQNVWEMFPARVNTDVHQVFHQAVADQKPAHFEAASVAAPGKWFEVHAYPSPEGLSVYLRDITERKCAEEERERLLTKLEEGNRRKDEFLAMLSHELRNPLAPISNALEVMRRSGADERERRSSREVISRQVDDLARLIDDLLDASRITSGKVRLELQTLELSGVVSRAIETTRPLIEARKHRLTVSLPAEPVWLQADPTRLAQVFSNLLNNAAKYTHEGGDISIKAEVAGSELVFAIRDTGVGIPVDVLPLVFDLFTQADRSLDRAQGGLGIGLTLARSIVQLHGGTVQAFSDGPNKGSEFVVRLPVVTQMAELMDEIRAVDHPPAASHRRVLVVDDNPDATETMSILLKMAGHEIEIAHDGDSALEAAERFKPQVILLDVGLPGMHGYEVAERLRSLPENKNVVLVALTGYGQERDRVRAMEAGFDYHFVKPVDFEKLEAVVNNPSRNTDATVPDKS